MDGTTNMAVMEKISYRPQNTMIVASPPPSSTDDDDAESTAVRKTHERVSDVATT